MDIDEETYPEGFILEGNMPVVAEGQHNPSTSDTQELTGGPSHVTPMDADDDGIVFMGESGITGFKRARDTDSEDDVIILESPIKRNLAPISNKRRRKTR